MRITEVEVEYGSTEYEIEPTDGRRTVAGFDYTVTVETDYETLTEGFDFSEEATPALRHALVVGSMLVAGAHENAITRKALCERVPGDFDTNVIVTGNLQGGDYSPVERAGVPQYAPSYGTVELTSVSAATRYIQRLTRRFDALEVEIEYED